MERTLADYIDVVGEEIVAQTQSLAGPLEGKSVVHVNSTRYGGGVAEILSWLVPLMNELGLNASWEVIEGNPDFFQTTKKIHNGLQGFDVDLNDSDIQAYWDTNERNFANLKDKVQDADFVIIHDPQPASFLQQSSSRRGKWAWRCHIDASRPNRAVWKFLEPLVRDYDASIFSMPQFARALPNRQFLIAPSIDPLSEKNQELPVSEVQKVLEQFKLDPERPILTQVSRYDRFKDPVGVIEAYKLVKKSQNVQLVLAGGGAADDPEGAEVLKEVHEAAGDDPDIRILDLPPDAHRTINALQRASTIIIQKSTREGFGLTVTEGLWKGKPVIGGDVGGIRLQVHDFHTGFLVNSPEGAALRIRYLFEHTQLRRRMGETAREFVLHNFLLTRHLQEYLALLLSMMNSKPIQMNFR